MCRHTSGTLRMKNSTTLQLTRTKTKVQVKPLLSSTTSRPARERWCLVLLWTTSGTTLAIFRRVSLLRPSKTTSRCRTPRWTASETLSRSPKVVMLAMNSGRAMYRFLESSQSPSAPSTKNLTSSRNKTTTKSVIQVAIKLRHYRTTRAGKGAKSLMKKWTRKNAERSKKPRWVTWWDRASRLKAFSSKCTSKTSRKLPHKPSKKIPEYMAPKLQSMRHKWLIQLINAWKKRQLRRAKWTPASLVSVPSRSTMKIAHLIQVSRPLQTSCRVNSPRTTCSFYHLATWTRATSTFTIRAKSCGKLQQIFATIWKTSLGISLRKLIFFKVSRSLQMLHLALVL